MQGMTEVFYPVSRDRRYTVTREYCGHAEPQWVVRFCHEWVASSQSRSSAFLMAVTEHARRNGALVIEGKPAQ